MDITLAYIDPGTGSLLISAFIGLALTLIYSIKGFIYNISHMVFGRGKSYLSDYSGKIVFFCESKTYWQVYKPVIEELEKREQKIVYLSADEDDEGLSISSQYVETHFVGEIRQAIYTLNRLKAKLCVMTTPQLDVIALKRSKYVEHYCHIIHAPTDIHSYKKFAFDYYDSVLCSSSAQINNIRYLEKERQTIPKQLFQTGCTYYDNIRAIQKEEDGSILLAPTWGDKTFFRSHGKKIIANLLDGGHKVILRPHPQSWISDKELLNDVASTYSSNNNFTIDKESVGENSLSKAKLLICDTTSGIIFDMAFVYRKPIIGIEYDWANGGYEASDLSYRTAAIDLLEDVGAIVDIGKIKDISDIVTAASQKNITKEIIDKHIYNYQNAGITAAEQILSLYQE
jgi:hypothetical protein